MSNLSPPPLQQLIYVSEAAPTLSLEALHAIVAQSAKHNASCNVSGILLMSGRSLMQLLEGDAHVIGRLYERICADPRHTQITKLLQKPVAKRLYPEWGMGLTDMRNRETIDHRRLARLVEDVRLASDTKMFSVESRVLVKDFLQQAQSAA